MTRRAFKLAAAVTGLTLAVAACKTNQGAAPASAGEVSAGASGSAAANRTAMAMRFMVKLLDR